MTQFPVRAPSGGFFLLDFKNPQATLSIKLENRDGLKDIYNFLSPIHAKKRRNRTGSVSLIL